MIDIAILAAKEAASLSLKAFNGLHTETYKTGKELVTEIDIASEQAIKTILKKHFPDHGFIGEEEGQEANKSEYTWIIDPIDGTVNYSRGIQMYGISIALARGEDVVLGVVYNPVSDELFSAEKGKGAQLNGAPIRVSNRTDLYQSVIYSTELFKTAVIVAPLFEKIKNFRITSSSAYETCLVACGRTEAFIKVTSHAWGFAAAGLIVEEAGGKVTNFDGTPWNINSTHILSSNGMLHEEIQKYLNVS